MSSIRSEEAATLGTTRPRDPQNLTHGSGSMPTLAAKATAYLEESETFRQAAIAVSEQKAEEAKLIAAQQAGFRAAMEIFAEAISFRDCELPSGKPRRRRLRRDISGLILRELSFSAKAMTATQVATAINYLPERTETALRRLESSGKLIRHEDGRWTIAIAAMAELNGHAVGA